MLRTVLFLKFLSHVTTNLRSDIDVYDRGACVWLRAAHSGLVDLS